MRTGKLRAILAVMVLLSGLVQAFGASDNLKALDRIVQSRKEYEREKRLKIDEARRNHSTATTDSDRYNTLRTLYKEYRNFRIDSAVIIADNRLDIARKSGTRGKVTSATLNLAESYVKSGLPEKALYMLDTLGKEQLEEYHRDYLNSVYKNAYTQLAKIEVLPEERKKSEEKVREYREKALGESERNSLRYYTLQAEKFVDEELYDQAVATIEEAARRFDFSNDAPMQYTMGVIYEEAGRRKEAIESLAKAAAIDLKNGTKEYQALILLSSLLFEEGDIERAFVYINCALEDINYSNATFRTQDIMGVMPVIDKAFHAYENEKKRLMRSFLWIAGALVLFLIILLILLLRTLRSNKRMLRTIAEINSELKDRNRKLEEADGLKLKSINILIMSHARYLSRLKEYRKTIYRFAKTGQYDKMLDALRSDRNNSKEVDEFHEMFDELFLSMFPDFVERVNELLTNPIALKENNRMTPELRVIALMRLGLSSTEEIAGILHYTSQTVYNLRSTIRSMSVLPREEFEKRVREL